MPDGISKTVFISGIIIAILASSLLSTVVSMNYARGPKGDKGDTGSQGTQGPQGEQGPAVNFSISNMTGWLSAPAYDSGWIDPKVPTPPFIFQHNLNTRNLYVYVIGKYVINATTYEIHQVKYGEAIFWKILSENTIEIYVNMGYDIYTYFRVMLWKISEP